MKGRGCYAEIGELSEDFGQLLFRLVTCCAEVLVVETRVAQLDWSGVGSTFARLWV
jgi:hypothetical protein